MRVSTITLLLCGATLLVAGDARVGSGQSKAPGRPSPATPIVRPDQPWLGVSRWQANHREVVLCGVLKDGPAGKAGLKIDDTILSIGGEPVRTTDDFHRLIDSYRPGNDAVVAFERDGQKASLSVTLEAIPPDGGTARILAAAEAGEGWAMVEIGVRYAHMRGSLSYCRKDPEEAVRWFRRSMETGHTTGPLFLAYVYRDGTGVEQDYAEAKRLYEKARLVEGDGVRKGVYTFATECLAGASLRGLGTGEDFLKAFQLYHDAALHGSLHAMWQVGKMCEAGQGVQQDASAAVGWYRSAWELGYEPAKKELDRLAPRN